jgi:hypothetical protein
MSVQGLPLPNLLVEMLGDGRWRHPGEQAVQQVMPWVYEELEFMPIETMRRETAGLARVIEEDELAGIFWVARGSAQVELVELPWLDIEAAVIIAMARYSDCIQVVLDYRTSAEEPRVVAYGEEWIDLHQGNTWTLGWRVVAPAFSSFVAALRC